MNEINLSERKEKLLKKEMTRLNQGWGWPRGYSQKPPPEV